MRMCFFFLLLLLPAAAFGHAVNNALAGAGSAEVFRFYFRLGFTHIVPFGLDHILFVVGLCLLADGWKPLLWQATAFTLAHSITLALSMTGRIDLPPDIVEPAIALSILFIALENLWVRKVHPWRVALIFLFGLVHGLGFAGILADTGLPPGKTFSSLLSFNLGVEAGQVAVIAVVYGIIVQFTHRKTWYRKGILWPASVLIGVAATYWFVDRI